MRDKMMPLARNIANDTDVETEGGRLHPEAPSPRFYIDHGMIHDRVTGKHVTTAPDDETWNGQTISHTLELLNALATDRKAPATPGSAERNARSELPSAPPLAEASNAPLAATLKKAYALNQEDIQTQPWVAQGLLIELAATIEHLLQMPQSNDQPREIGDE